jgi:hypothetical protein
VRGSTATMPSGVTPMRSSNSRSRGSSGDRRPVMGCVPHHGPPMRHHLPCTRAGASSRRGRKPVSPPSTVTFVPVVDPASGLARASTARATSSGRTSRPWGWRCSRAACSRAGSAAWDSSRSTQGVPTVPGLTQLTRTPSARWSAAMARVSESTAPLVALYRARSGSPTRAATEQTLTIEAWPVHRTAPQDSVPRSRRRRPRPSMGCSAAPPRCSSVWSFAGRDVVSRTKRRVACDRRPPPSPSPSWWAEPSQPS